MGTYPAAAGRVIEPGAYANWRELAPIIWLARALLIEIAQFTVRNWQYMGSNITIALNNARMGCELLKGGLFGEEFG